jgi:predicted nucleic acid-binding protein
MIFVDTNYFLRFLINDGTDHHQEASKLIARASEGKIIITTDIVVIFEIYWVLGKVYHLDRPQIKKLLLSVCNLDFLVLSERQVLLETVRNFDQFNYDLEDAYHFYNCQAQKITKIATFDKKLINKFKNL